jgi:hypothetical protein
MMQRDQVAFAKRSFDCGSSFLCCPTMFAKRFWHTMHTSRKKEHMPNMADNGRLLTLYRTTQTNRFNGILKKLIMVERRSSGTY